MNRPSGQYSVRTAGSWLLLLIGAASGILGLVISGVECYHAVFSRHPVIWQNLAAAALFLAGGASIIQTGNVKETLGVLRDAWPLMSERRVGGNRKTDPPPDDQ